MVSTRSGVWVITKYDGAEKKWERKLKANKFTRIQIGHALSMLACTHLTSEEVMDTIDPSRAVSLFNFHEEDGLITCGLNPHYVAKHHPYGS